MSVRTSPGCRLRRWCSSGSLRIPPLHPEFRIPLLASSSPVSHDPPQLSRGLSRTTRRTTCERFTPNKSGQRLPPTYYRGCWHVVSRGLDKVPSALGGIIPKLFVPYFRTLHPEGLHRSRGIAGSGFRPLPKIPNCCLP